jgi:hypothetical protein
MCPGMAKKPVGWKPDRLTKSGSIPTPAATPERLIYGGGRQVGKTEAQRIAGMAVVIDERVPDGVLIAKDKAGNELGRIVVAVDPARPGGDLTHGEPRKPGRPKSIEDMRAYKAQKQREYRQRQKEAGK